MNCSEFETELEQMVESRAATLTDFASSHLSQCAACHQRWNDYRLIESALLSWRQIPKMSSFADRLIQQLGEEQSTRRVPASMVPPKSAATGNAWIAVVAAAACLILTVGLGTGLRSRTTQQSLTRVQNVDAHSSDVRPIESSQMGVASSVAAVLDDLRAEYQELAAETSATARDFAVALPPAPLSTWPDSQPKATTETTGVPEDTGVQPSSGTVSALGRSIGTQISQAMDFLRVAVPDNVPRG